MARRTSRPKTELCATRADSTREPASKNSLAPWRVSSPFLWHGRNGKPLAGAICSAKVTPTLQHA